MKRVNKFKVNTFNKRFKEVWKYCNTLEKALELREFGVSNGLCSSILEYKDGKWNHV